MDPTTIPPSSTPPTPATTLGERRMAAGVHLGAMVLAFFTSWLAGVAGMVCAGIVAAIRPMDSSFVASHAKAAFNFSASMFIYLILGVLLTIITLGIALIVLIPFAIVIGLTWLVCSIVAASKAIDGELYRYPFSIRLL